MKITRLKKIPAITLFFFSIFLVNCVSFPDNHKQLGRLVFKSFKNKNFNSLWSLCMQKPSVRKQALVDLYRSGKITKKVYQRDMGRVEYLAKKEKQKLKQDYERIINLIKNLNIKTNLLEISKPNGEKQYFSLKIGEQNHSISVNVHYDVVDGDYFLISLYSIT